MLGPGSVTMPGSRSQEPITMSLSSLTRTVAAAALGALAISLSAEDDAGAANLLSLAAGTIPVALSDNAEDLRVGMDRALMVIDGDTRVFSLNGRPGGPDTRIELVYQLPALTRFQRFAIPGVLETPSPSQTFFREIEIEGSAEGPDGPFAPLATTTLSQHERGEERTDFPAISDRPVRWLRVGLAGGLDLQRDQTFFEFSELMGFGEQESVPLLEAFNARWSGRGVRLELKQDGQRVSGCYDRDGDLTGTVRGNLLTATGTTRSSATPSTFLLTVDDQGQLIGVRSSNGAPFRLYNGSPDPDLITACSEVEVGLPGCESILHGIQFDFDSDRIRPESETLLDDLYAGLEASDASAVLIIGHSSSEGDESYNAALSQRRAEAVRRALIERGANADRLTAQGAGESRPIADNETDAGRAMNRRVEIACSQ
jgi:outer membrane protein OmpA-like peptidoglycan-associated protein